MAAAIGSPYTATCDSEGVNALLRRRAPLVCWATHVDVAALNTAMLLVLVAHTSRWCSPAVLLLALHAAAPPPDDDAGVVVLLGVWYATLMQVVPCVVRRCAS